MEVKNVLRDFSDKLKNELAERLRSPTMDENDIQKMVFTRYISVFHPHFIVWVAGMQNSCITPTGKYAASSNIVLELVENHQGMLWDFMSQCGVTPDAEEYKKLLPEIGKVNKFVAVTGVKFHHGYFPAAVIYFLEEASKVFIPWLAKAARNLGAKKMQYPDAHGEADFLHSDLAFEAVIAESQIDCVSKPTDVSDGLQLVYKSVRELLFKIFDGSLS
jgi:hypothetical protein